MGKMPNSPMNSSTSGLENDCSLVKNFLSFKEAVEAHFPSFFWFHSLYFGFTYSIRDALSHPKTSNN